MQFESAIHCPSFLDRVNEVLIDEKLDEFRRFSTLRSIVVGAVKDFSTDRGARRWWYWHVKSRVTEVAKIRMYIQCGKIREKWFFVIKVLTNIVKLQRRVKIFLLRPNGKIFDSLKERTLVGKDISKEKN